TYSHARMLFVGPVVYDINFFFSSRRRHTRSKRDWSSDVCSSDLGGFIGSQQPQAVLGLIDTALLVPGVAVVVHPVRHTGSIQQGQVFGDARILLAGEIRAEASLADDKLHACVPECLHTYPDGAGDVHTLNHGSLPLRLRLGISKGLLAVSDAFGGGVSHHAKD